MISIRDVTYRIGQKALVDGISFNVHPGQVTALVGANGAGKSTSMKLMSGEWSPSEGSVSIDGASVRDIPVDQLALKRSVLSQQSALTFGFKVQEVVHLGRTPHGSSTHIDAVIAERAMAIAEVDHLAERFYPTLSGGEQQRVHLARALAQIWEKPVEGHRYLLLDEPTSNLDLAHQHAVLQTARDCADAGVGVFAILHDLNLAAQYADHLIVLHEGSVVAQGTAEAVLTPDIILKAYNIPVMVTANPCAACPMVVPIPGRQRDPQPQPEYPLPVV